MQIQTIRGKLKEFESKFEPFEMDSKHSNANSNHSTGIRSIRMQIEPFERDSKHSNANSKHSKLIRSILMQIQAIRKGLEAFERKF